MDGYIGTQEYSAYWVSFIKWKAKTQNNNYTNPLVKPELLLKKKISFDLKHCWSFNKEEVVHVPNDILHNREDKLLLSLFYKITVINLNLLQVRWKEAMCMIKRESNKSYKIKADGMSAEEIRRTFVKQQNCKCLGSEFRVHVEDSHETSKAVE